MKKRTDDLLLRLEFAMGGVVLLSEMRKLFAESRREIMRLRKKAK